MEGNLIINGGAIQTATGNIDIKVGGNLSLQQNTFTTLGVSFGGSIRTTGCPLGGADPSSYWLYGNGGNISLRVGGSIHGQSMETGAWDTFNDVGDTWSAYYTYNGSGFRATEGLATMGGGNLSVYAGGNFYAQAGAFGYQQSNLQVFSGGDMAGRFLVRNGVAVLSAMGNFGGAQNTLIEAAPAFSADLNSAANPDAHIYVTAQGGLVLPAVVNPTFAENIDGNEIDNLGYSQTSSVSLVSARGDVAILGKVPATFSNYASTPGHNIMPATLDVDAGRDILIEGGIVLAPYAQGSLSLVAGRDINGANGSGHSSSQILVSDLDPSLAYGQSGGLLTSPRDHDPSILHLNDPTGPIIVNAGRDLENISLDFPKAAQVSAGRDIVDIFFLGQNVAQTDTTVIKAGRNITFGTSENTSENSGIQQTGPGELIVQAGGNIDLGASLGIQSEGNSSNLGLASLYSEGASVMVIAGISRDTSFGDASGFFDQLRTAGTQYSKLMAQGDTAGAQQLIKTTSSTVIQPFIGSSATQGAGDIDMTSSQIATLGGGEINIFSNNTINVGKTAFITDAQRQGTGIYTGFGGAINVFSEKNVNVNESRVMTYMGGDITVWSNTGNINAGRGSKTVITASPPTAQPVNGVLMLVFHAPGEGSGIRTFTYYPEGVDGPIKAPPQGDIYMFAPQGVIDAGEAGIAGRNVILGAVQVLNVNNIVFSGTSVGVPSSANVGGLGALTGMGAVTQDMKSQEASVMRAASSKLAQDASASSEAFSAAWLEVRVLSFFEVDPGDGAWEKTDN